VPILLRRPLGWALSGLAVWDAASLLRRMGTVAVFALPGMMVGSALAGKAALGGSLLAFMNQMRRYG
jgi:predicted membrane protein